MSTLVDQHVVTLRGRIEYIIPTDKIDVVFSLITQEMSELVEDVRKQIFDAQIKINEINKPTKLINDLSTKEFDLSEYDLEMERLKNETSR
jgi:hypothetical protein